MHTVQATIVSYCKLCTILISLRQESEQDLMKYAAHCFYKEKNKNDWILNIIFLKELKAHFQVLYRWYILRG